MKIVVTGASGFIGREIVSLLQKHNHEVVSFISLSGTFTGDLPNTVRVDISDLANLRKNCELETVDILIHSAGLAHQFGKTVDEDFLNVNVKGTENIANLAVKLKTKYFILISSVAVYGNSGENRAIDEAKVCNPKGIYAISKFKSEEVAKKICEENKIPLTILRPTTVIGENDRGNTARLIEAIYRKRFIWIGKGENRKSLIYKKDVARACLQVLEKKTSETEIFNVTGEALKMKEIVNEIGRNLKREILPFRIPEGFLGLFFGVNKHSVNIGKVTNLQETVKKWVSNDVFSGNLIQEKYGFEATTKISDALKQQTQFYLKNLKSDK